MFDTNDYYINFPDKANIWIVWGFLLMGFLISGFLIRKPGRNLARINLIWLAILSILLPITSLFGGISLKISDAISININILNAIPWFLAAGLSGVLPSLILAFTAGLLTSLSASHSILTPLVFTAIALLFNILIGVRKHELSEAPALSPIKATLWTLLAILGIAGIGIVLLLTTSQNAILTAFSFTLIKEVLSLLPALLIAGVLSQLAAVFLKYFWTPLKLQKPRYSTKKINRTLVFAHSLANGAEPPSEQQLKKHGPLGELNRSLKNIKQKLNTKYASQSYVRMLDSVFLDEISLEKLLQQILSAALSIAGNNARVVLYAKDSHDIMKSSGKGFQNLQYKYLDEFLPDLLRAQNTLYISDIRKSPLFKGVHDHPFPQAIIALSIPKDSDKMGFLWIAFEEVHPFSEEELESFGNLQTKIAAILTNFHLMNAIKEKNKVYKEIVAKYSQPLIYYDTTGKVIYQNYAGDVFNFHDLVDKDQQSLKDIVNHINTSWLRYESGEKVKTIDMRLIGLPSKEFKVDIYPVLQADTIEGYICICIDISKHQETNAQKSEFVTNVSHDLRRPLALIKGYIAMVENIGNLNEQQKVYVDRIDSEVNSMNRLVSNVLDLEKFDSGNPLRLTETTLREVIDSAREPFDSLAMQKKIKMEIIHSPASEKTIQVDPVLIEQAIANLIDNAIKYSSMGGKVWIETQETERHYQISVRDEGVGIAPLDQPKLFQRFYHSVDAEDQSFRGSGLGLAIVKSVAERHGGTVGVVSRLGKGSTFTISLPKSMLKPA